MKRIILTFIAILSISSILLAQMIFGNVHCKVIDAQTKEAISGVTVGLQDNVKQYSSHIGRTNSEGEIDLGVSYTDVLIFFRKSGYVTQIVKPKSKENTIKFYKTDGVNKSKSKNEFEKMINQLLEDTEYATLSYKITRAIMNGKNFLEISNSALLQQLPTGSTISVAGFFDMKLRLKNNELGWVLDGVLVKEFVSLGIIPTQPNSF